MTMGRTASMDQWPGERSVPQSQREGQRVSPLKEVWLALFLLLYKDTCIPGGARGERAKVLDSCQVVVCTGIARGFGLKCRCWHHLWGI